MSEESTVAVIMDRYWDDEETCWNDAVYPHPLETWSRGSYKPPASVEFPEAPEPDYFDPNALAF